MRSKKPFWTEDEGTHSEDQKLSSFSWLDTYRRQLSWIKSPPVPDEDLTKEFTAEF